MEVLESNNKQTKKTKTGGHALSISKLLECVPPNLKTPVLGKVRHGIG